jgi:hypothetical protein
MGCSAIHPPILVSVIAMAGSIGNAPAKETPSLQERALDLIGSRSSGIFQSELRRLLDIESSKCSKVVSKLESRGLIRRERVPASRSFLINLTRKSIKSASCRLVDSYLTEIYLLYLIRNIC